LEDCVRLGKVTRDGVWVVFDEASHAQIRQKYNPGAVASAKTQTPRLRTKTQEPRLPGKGRLMLNAAGAALRAGKAAVKAQPVLRSLEEARACLEKCKTSGPEGGPCLFFRASDLRCAHQRCGCFLNPEQVTPLPSKTRIATEHCPLTPPQW
jgi:hypothetical protein